MLRIALLLCLSLPGPAATIFLNFESLADGDSLTTQFPGLTFARAIAAQSGLSINELDFPPRSGNVVLLDDGGPLSVQFTAPVSFASAYLTYSQPVTLTAFDLLDNVLGSYTSQFDSNFVSSGNPPNELFSLSFAQPSISRLVFAGAPTGFSFTLDDLSAGTSDNGGNGEIPEPSTALLALGALAAFGWARKRRALASLAFLPLLAHGATVSNPAANPPVVAPNVPTLITVTTQVQLSPGEPNVTSVNLLRLNATGGASLLSAMRDDGQNGDAVAGDSIFTARISINESGVNPLTLQASVALRGILRRFTSGLTSIPFAGGSSSATLNISVFESSPSSPNGLGAAAGAGVEIRVNNVLLGLTNAQGQFTATVNPGPLEVQASLAAAAIGLASVEPLPGQTLAVNIPLEREKEFVEPVTLSIDEMTGSLLPNNVSTVTLRFRRPNGAAVPVKTIGLLEFDDAQGIFLGAVDPFFTIQPDGSLRANRSALDFILTSTNKLLNLRTTFTGQDDIAYGGILPLYFARFTITGTLTRPPSEPNLPLANIQVRARVLQTSIELVTTTDSTGAYSFPRLPFGNIEVSAESLFQSKFYYGFAQFILDRNRNVSLAMLNISDILNNVPAFSLNSPPVFATSLPLANESSLIAGSESTAPPRNGPGPLPPWLQTPTKPLLARMSENNTASASTTASAQNVAVTRSATLNLPQGTKRVKLTYNVASNEYPFYVLNQSEFNDVWSIRVMSAFTGQILFSRGLNVNSQLFVEPLWREDGTTGNVDEEINVEALTVSTDALVTVVVSATNIGDSQLATSVIGTLSINPVVKIDTLTAQPISQAISTIANAGAISASNSNDGRGYSIAAPGELNRWQRAFEVRYTAMTGATVTKLKIVLKAASSSQVLSEEGITTSGPVRRINANTLRGFATHFNIPSSINATPPPAFEQTYCFTLTVDYQGQSLESNEKCTPALRPLWRMPASVPRYGARDVGGDDWIVRGAFSWLTDNAALLTRLDDASGEHGRYIGHSGHVHGDQFDMFHFFTVNNAASGGDNYRNLRSQVIAAFQGNAAARTTVASWATAMRNGLVNLASDLSITRIYTNYGTALAIPIAATPSTPATTVNVAAGWARQLLETGSINGSGNTTVDFGIGAWSTDCAGTGTNKIKCDPTFSAGKSMHVHDDHIHFSTNLK